MKTKSSTHNQKLRCDTLRRPEEEKLGTRVLEDESWTDDKLKSSPTRQDAKIHMKMINYENAL